ncbi:MAG: hypothetical protein KMY53_15185, partial [Desulfarculus sp.]|nr:hypothetical protein [Pseudomonadota bacterium]MBU4574023.1 hypothetical protein [Pseudomonadota bacterium]MBV1717273.1 hypothetical protein [Desulfarculus sp.]MBV1739509.1 hypothetical protein [Desulfarculus sp.]
KGPRAGAGRPDKTVPEQYLGLESWINLSISAEIRLKTNAGNYAALSIPKLTAASNDLRGAATFVGINNIESGLRREGRLSPYHPALSVKAQAGRKLPAERL